MICNRVYRNWATACRCCSANIFVYMFVCAFVAHELNDTEWVYFGKTLRFQRTWTQYPYHPPFPLQHAALPACHTKQWQLSHLTFTIKIVIIIWHTHTYIHIHSRICTQLLIHIQHDFPAVHNRFRRHCRAHHRHHRHHHQQQHHFHDYYDDQRQQRIVISW